jgi:hypothetical protein
LKKITEGQISVGPLNPKVGNARNGLYFRNNAGSSLIFELFFLLT